MKKIVLFLFLFRSFSIGQITTCGQFVLVVAPNWNSSAGQMYLFEKNEQHWIQYNKPWNVNLGSAGLAWGNGLHSVPKNAAIKHEGDSRSPAGIFELGDCFGYNTTPPMGLMLSYHESAHSLRCVDDTSSVFYNSIIDENDVIKDSSGSPPWRTAEKMRMDSTDYKYLIVVRHNPENIPGRGSCIFIHVERISVPPTLGCTSMNEVSMEFLLRWLDPAKRPLLVQLPLDECKKFLLDNNIPPLSRN